MLALVFSRTEFQSRKKRVPLYYRTTRARSANQHVTYNIKFREKNPRRAATMFGRQTKAKPRHQRERLVDSEQYSLHLQLRKLCARSFPSRDVGCNQMSQVTFVSTLESASNPHGIHRKTQIISQACGTVTTGSSARKPLLSQSQNVSGPSPKSQPVLGGIEFQSEVLH